jgi:hypothetical protein
MAPSKLEMKRISKCISAAAVFLAFAPNAMAGSVCVPKTLSELVERKIG